MKQISEEQFLDILFDVNKTVSEEDKESKFCHVTTLTVNGEKRAERIITQNGVSYVMY